MIGVYAWISLFAIHVFFYPLTALWIRSGYSYQKIYVAASIAIIVLQVIVSFEILFTRETRLVRFSFLMKQMRIFLKSVAFVVETVWKERRYRDLSHKKKTDEERKEDSSRNNETSISDASQSHHEINKCLDNNNKEDIEARDSSTLVPSSRHFIYFSFAPVYVYMYSYPRNKSRDLGLIATLSCVICILVYILFQKKTAVYFI